MRSFRINVKKPNPRNRSVIQNGTWNHSLFSVFFQNKSQLTFIWWEITGNGPLSRAQNNAPNGLDDDRLRQ
jgi:hypothetical protein